MQDGIRGEVVVELTFDANGEIIEYQVLSAPEELRSSGLRSALTGHYQVRSPRSFQVIVDYSAPPGAVLTDNGKPIVGLANGDAVMAGILESIKLDGLPEPVRIGEMNRLQIFRGRSMSPDLLREILATVDTETVGKVTAQIVRLTPTGDSTLELVFGGEDLTSYTTVFAPAIRVESALQAERLLKRVDPAYPAQGLKYRIQGVVHMDVWITPDGRVASVQPTRGHPLFLQSAHRAVSQWVYKPTDGLDNIVTEIKVEFRFQNGVDD